MNYRMCKCQQNLLSLQNIAFWRSFPPCGYYSSSTFHSQPSEKFGLHEFKSSWVTLYQPLTFTRITKHRTMPRCVSPILNDSSQVVWCPPSSYGDATAPLSDKICYPKSFKSAAAVRCGSGKPSPISGGANGISGADMMGRKERMMLKLCKKVAPLLAGVTEKLFGSQNLTF